MVDNFLLYVLSNLRRPYVIIFIALTALSSLLLVLLTSFYSSVTTFINELDYVKEFKIIEVYLENEEQIENIPHVIHQYKADAYSLDVSSSHFDVEDVNGAFTLFAVHNDNLPKILYGNKTLDDNKMEMICPTNFFPINNRGNNFLIKPLSIRYYLNKNIPIKYINEHAGMTQQTNLKLTGIYLNNKLVNDISICYVNYKTMEKLTNDIYNMKTNNVLLEVDSVKNIDKVKSYLNKENIEYKSISWIDLEFYYKILDLDIVLIIIFSFILAFITIFITEIVFNKNKKSLVLYYNLGYSVNCITKFYFLGNLTLWLMISTITTLLSIVYDSFSYNLSWSFPFIAQNFTNVVNMRTVIYVVLFTLFITLSYTLIRIIDIKRRNV